MEEYTQITLDEWVQWKEDIRRKLAETANNFVYIGFRLKQIRDSGMFGGAADIFEFAQNEYGLGKSTVSRFIAINEKYSEGGNSLELREEFRNYSSSKLSEMLTLPDKEIELINERTTIRAIRELKKFDAEDPEKVQEAEEPTERAWTPLEKCVIDFFKEKPTELDDIMMILEQEEPDYKRAAEIMAPSGQAFHKKGIVFLFFYEYKDGVKYKLMTSPDPVTMEWPEFLNLVYGIYSEWAPGQVHKHFYHGQEKAGKTVENQGAEPVATSQQIEEKPVEKEPEKEPEAAVEPVEQEPDPKSEQEDEVEQVAAGQEESSQEAAEDLQEDLPEEAEEPAEEPVQEQAEEPAGQQDEETVEETTEEPADEATEPPAGDSGDEPEEEPAEEPEAAGEAENEPAEAAPEPAEAEAEDLEDERFREQQIAEIKEEIEKRIQAIHTDMSFARNDVKMWVRIKLGLTGAAGMVQDLIRCLDGEE